MSRNFPDSEQPNCLQLRSRLIRINSDRRKAQNDLEEDYIFGAILEFMSLNGMGPAVPKLFYISNFLLDFASLFGSFECRDYRFVLTVLFCSKCFHSSKCFAKMHRSLSAWLYILPHTFAIISTYRFTILSNQSGLCPYQNHWNNPILIYALWNLFLCQSLAYKKFDS